MLIFRLWKYLKWLNFQFLDTEIFSIFLRKKVTLKMSAGKKGSLKKGKCVFFPRKTSHSAKSYLEKLTSYISLNYQEIPWYIKKARGASLLGDLSSGWRFFLGKKACAFFSGLLFFQVTFFPDAFFPRKKRHVPFFWVTFFRTPILHLTFINCSSCIISKSCDILYQGIDT